MTMDNLMKNRVRFYAILALLTWSALCAAVIFTNDHADEKEINDEARIMARTSTDKDIAYRHWVAERGGVYAQVSDNLQPNPFLKHPERDLKTPSGRRLTLLNPAYMTRQVFEQEFSLKTSPWSHITSLKPLRPANAPDDWEAEALRAFERGAAEYGERWNYQGEPVYRYMRPLQVKESCLTCHGDQGYEVGDIRGGISVMVPVQDFIRSARQNNRAFVSTVGSVWLVGLLGIGFSWRRMAQSAKSLQAEHDSMQMLFEAAPTGMLLFDRDLEIRLANRAFRDSYCLAESPCGKRFGDIFRCESAQAEPAGCGFSDACSICPVRSALLAALNEGQVSESDECRITSGEDGSLRVFLFSVTPLKFAGEDGALLSLADISRQKAAEQEREKLQLQLMQSQKIESIGRLAGGVAHDFNNMLSTIMGNVELGLLKLQPGDVLEEHLRQIKDAARRSSGLTRQLLGFARQQPIEPHVLQFDYAIEDMLQMLRRLIGEDISLEWKPGARDGRVLIDPTQLSQILTNLTVNARDAIATTGSILLATEPIVVDEAYVEAHPWSKVGHYLCLSVSDDGCGMTREVQEHIFEPFYTTKDIDKGTGLGLANVYGIVKQNQGFINVYSEPDEGTTFRIYLRQTLDEVEDDEPEGTDLVAGSERILLVEDEAMLLEISTRMLEAAGYEVVAFSDPEEALRQAAEGNPPFDLLLTDVIMPGLNGRELAEQLRVRQPGLKVLYMSGYTADIIETRGLLDTGIRLLQKPFAAEELCVRVREVLDS